MSFRSECDWSVANALLELLITSDPDKLGSNSYSDIQLKRMQWAKYTPSKLYSQ